MSRFSDRYAVRKSAAVRRKRLLTQAFCRHSIQYEGAPAPSYSPCKKELLSFKQGIFDKLRGETEGSVSPLFCKMLLSAAMAGFPSRES